MAKKKDQGLPVAVATHGGLLATLAVLLIGTLNGARAWILLLKAAMTFLLVSGLLRLLSAAVLQFIRLKADKAETKDESEEVQETAHAISTSAQSPESMESVPS